MHWSIHPCNLHAKICTVHWAWREITGAPSEGGIAWLGRFLTSRRDGFGQFKHRSNKIICWNIQSCLDVMGVLEDTFQIKKSFWPISIKILTAKLRLVKNLVTDCTYLREVHDCLPRLLAMFDIDPLSQSLGVGDRRYWPGV